MKTWMKWAIAAVVVAVLAVVGGPFIYINFIKDDPADELESGCVDPQGTAPDSPTGGSAFTASGGRSIDPDEAAGDWTVGAGTVGYRVVEVLFGQDTTAVGRSTDVTGTATVEAGQITAASFAVDMATFTSPEQQRDRQFRGRIMDAEQFPTATFDLTQPIPVPSAETANSAVAAGDLTLHGVTNPVTIEMTALDCGTYIDVLGSTDIVFADYSIPDPSATGISTQDHGLLEVKLQLVPA